MKSIQKIKARYYSREVLKYLLTAGVIAIAASSPSASLRITRHIFNDKKTPRRKRTDTFRYLKKRGLIRFQKLGHDVSITLTPEGKKLAGKYQINDLCLERPKEWDKKWRVVIFDLPSVSKTSNLIRNVFRTKLKEFGFYLLQKSIWIYPFACEEEITFLREFLGADKKQIQVLEVVHLENEDFFKKVFRI